MGKDAKVKKCKECGRELLKKEAVCKECHPPITFSSLLTPSQDINAEYKRIRLLWVLSVTMFWVTIGLLGAIYMVFGNSYLTEIMLISVILLFSGIYLKTKMLALQRKKSNVLTKDNN